MQSDKTYRRSLHTILNDYIPEDIIEKGNKELSWNYGYHKKYDLIVISRDGTLGQIVEIENLKIGLPQPPKQVRNYNIARKFQKWKRHEVPKQLSNFDKNNTDETNKDSIIVSVFHNNKQFIDADFKRKFDGEFIYIDGEIIYIPGGYYFFLQNYMLTDGKYPDFRITQRDYFIFLEACYADPRCYGSLMLKGRRSSFTVTLASEMLRSAITKRRGYYPIVSKTDRDASNLFTKHIVRPFLKFPKHLQPQRTGEAKPKSKLEFNSPQKKITLNNKSSTDDTGLDTYIEPLATTVDAYDGSEVTISGNDEIGKFKGNLDINEYWEQAHKMTHEVGSDIVGKAICGSTANPPNKGGKNYEEFYNNSKTTQRNDIGQTSTGLYAIFIPADYSTRGFFDEYGWVIYDNPDGEEILNERGTTVNIGSKQYLDSKELACAGNQKKLNAQKRNNPRVDTDAFLDEDASSMYGTEGVTNHANFLKTFEKNPKYELLVTKFDLYWKDGIKDNPAGVEIKHTPKGRFQSSWMPLVEFRNQVNVKDGGRRYPVNTALGAFGVDPYQSDRAKYGTGSNQGFVGVTKNNEYLLAPNERNKVFLYYNHRPDTIEEAIDDVIKAMVYFSMPVLPETNKDKLVTTLYKRGYRGYVLEDPTKLKSELSNDGKKYGGIYSSNASVPHQEEALKTFIIENINDNVDEDDLKIAYLKMLEELQIYNGGIRQKCDTTVALQLAVLANTKYKKKEPKTEETITQYDIMDLFKTAN
jgi:hypothetical protein